MLLSTVSLAFLFSTLQLIECMDLSTPNRHSVYAAVDSTLAFSPNSAYALIPRQLTCGTGNKLCGTGCIPNSYTCCSSGVGGCPSTSYCVPLGCCPNGRSCGSVSGGCNQGETDCGKKCVPPGGSCCPDKSGCFTGYYCYLQTIGTYDCCINGENCGGVAVTTSVATTGTTTTVIATTRSTSIPTSPYTSSYTTPINTLTSLRTSSFPTSQLTTPIFNTFTTPTTISTRTTTTTDLVATSRAIAPLHTGTTWGALGICLLNWYWLV